LNVGIGDASWAIVKKEKEEKEKGRGGYQLVYIGTGGGTNTSRVHPNTKTNPGH